MSKLRFVMVDVEGFDSSHLSALADVISGRPAAPVAAQEALPAPPAALQIQEPAPPARRTYVRRAKANGKAEAAAPAPGSTNDLILQALRKGPKSPMELAKALGCANEPQRVYAATSVLKAKGLIESKPVGGDDDDGTRRWHLV